MGKTMRVADHLESRDWSRAVPDTGQPAETVVMSLRMPVALAERIFREAERRQMKPSALMREILDRGLTEIDQSATVSVADLQAAIARLAKREAA
jgi:hypothetical protein